MQWGGAEEEGGRNLSRLRLSASLTQALISPHSDHNLSGNQEYAIQLTVPLGCPKNFKFKDICHLLGGSKCALMSSVMIEESDFHLENAWA